MKTSLEKYDLKRLSPVAGLLGVALVGIGTWLWWSQRQVMLVAGSSMGLVWPVVGRITSLYGYRTNPITRKKELHNGIDIAAPAGTAVLAPASGKVASVYSNSSGGNQLLIDHDHGLRTGYAHLNTVNVRTGQVVQQGQVVASVGSTGQASGPHLHFTLRSAGLPVDPAPYLT